MQVKRQSTPLSREIEKSEGPSALPPTTTGSDTGEIGFLNDSGYIFVEFVLQCSLRLLFEQRKKYTEIGND